MNIVSFHYFNPQSSCLRKRKSGLGNSTVCLNSKDNKQGFYIDLCDDFSKLYTQIKNQNKNKNIQIYLVTRQHENSFPRTKMSIYPIMYLFLYSIMKYCLIIYSLLIYITYNNYSTYFYSTPIFHPHTIQTL